MTLKEATRHALTILKQVMEEKLNSTNIEVSLVIFLIFCFKSGAIFHIETQFFKMSVVATKDRKFHLFSKEEIEEVIKDM